jgi:NAD(P)-dependent dehydrogenase (short-subunit alcohol dehydrogenase family)
MEIAGKVCAVTGAASGIGRALARRFKADGAAGVAVADLDAAGLAPLADELGALAVTCDVAREDEVQRLIAETEAAYGPIDIYCSNAGIVSEGGEEAPDAEWQRNWDGHLMAHVYAARVLASQMAERGAGYIVLTASAAGVLSHPDSATYAVPKHATVAFAEWLSINYGDKGVGVSALCPQAVRTAMTQGREGSVASVDGMIEPEELAECVVQSMAREEFLILPHPEVLEYMRRKTADYDRWLGGMRRFKAKYADT